MEFDGFCTGVDAKGIAQKAFGIFENQTLQRAQCSTNRLPSHSVESRFEGVRVKIRKSTSFLLQRLSLIALYLNAAFLCCSISKPIFEIIYWFICRVFSTQSGARSRDRDESDANVDIPVMRTCFLECLLNSHRNRLKLTHRKAERCALEDAWKATYIFFSSQNSAKITLEPHTARHADA